jgi:hypothetical protein
MFQAAPRVNGRKSADPLPLLRRSVERPLEWVHSCSTYGRCTCVALQKINKQPFPQGVIMNKILTSLFLGTLLTIGGIALAAGTAADPVVGTWTLNAAKTTTTSGPATKSQTRIYSQSAQGITLNMKTVGVDGKEMNSQTTYHLDGRDYPVTGNRDYDSLSGKQIDANTAEFTLKKAGKAVGTTRRTVAKDGKTLTATFTLTTAGGEKSENVAVFDKQ